MQTAQATQSHGHEKLEFGAVFTGQHAADLLTGPAAALPRFIVHFGVIVLRGQALSDRAHEDLLLRLGTPMITPGEALVAGSSWLNPVSNVGRKTPPRSVFHSDSSYLDRPPSFTALRSVVCPTSGGETLFTDQRRAFISLPPPCQAALMGRNVSHRVTGVAGQDQKTRQPLVRRHPSTGLPALYLTTPARLSAVDGCSAAQSDRLISALYRWSQRPGRVYRHQWQLGDVVIWDNRITMHRADHSAVEGDRVLHRGMVLGEAPIPA